MVTAIRFYVPSGRRVHSQYTEVRRSMQSVCCDVRQCHRISNTRRQRGCDFFRSGRVDDGVGRSTASECDDVTQRTSSFVRRATMLMFTGAQSSSVLRQPLLCIIDSHVRHIRWSETKANAKRAVGGRKKNSRFCVASETPKSHPPKSRLAAAHNTPPPFISGAHVITDKGPRVFHLFHSNYSAVELIRALCLFGGFQAANSSRCRQLSGVIGRRALIFWLVTNALTMLFIRQVFKFNELPTCTIYNARGLGGGGIWQRKLWS